MPSSWRPGLRGMDVFGRCGAGASAIPEVYRRGPPANTRHAAIRVSGRDRGSLDPAPVDVPEPRPVEDRRDRVQRDDRDEVDGVSEVEADRRLEQRVVRAAD